MTAELTIEEREELITALFPNRGRLSTVEKLTERYPQRNLPLGALVTRVAPSPTGMMHIGTVYTGLINRRLATQSGGVFILRIEDTDTKRTVPGAVEKIIRSMRSFQIEPDEGSILNSTGEISETGSYGPYTQSQRSEIYQSCVLHLLQKGDAYPCFLSPEELDHIREQQSTLRIRPGIYGRWAKHRNLSSPEILKLLKEGKPWVIRVRSMGDHESHLVWQDQSRGRISMPENDLDHVILKGDGLPTYHMAHVVDDHFMGTTDVIRGDEWMASVPLHLQLFSLMGWDAPRYTHIAPIQKLDLIPPNESSGEGKAEGGVSRRKLSKRHDPEANVDYFITAGYPPLAMIEYLSNLANSNFEDWRKTDQLSPAAEFKFTVEKLNNAGPLVDLAKLNDISKDVISRFGAEQMFAECLAWAESHDTEIAVEMRNDPTYAKEAINIERSGVKPSKRFATWADSKVHLRPFFDKFFAVIDPLPFPPNIEVTDRRKILDLVLAGAVAGTDSSSFFEKLKELASSLGFAANVKDYKKNPSGFKGHVGDVAMVLRVALFGAQQTPDLFELMRVLGAERVKARLERAITCTA